MNDTDWNGSVGSSPHKRPVSIAWISIGALFGGLIGYSLRPSVILIGKLPLNVVASRGANLVGADRLLVDTAVASFNVTLACVALGGLIGWICARLLAGETRDTLVACRDCGRRVSRQAITCPGCGVPSPTTQRVRT